jgi:hypothetical protein
MDTSSIFNAMESTLIELGLEEKGHIIALKCFASSHNTNKATLAASIRTASMERASTKTKSREKSVTLGWKHFNPSKEKYCMVKMANGGGIRETKFPENATIADIRKNVITLFFSK